MPRGLPAHWGTTSVSPFGDAKIIVSCSIGGGLAYRSQCPAVPHTRVEIAEEVRRGHEAGATVVPVHAREDVTEARKSLQI